MHSSVCIGMFVCYLLEMRNAAFLLFLVLCTVSLSKQYKIVDKDNSITFSSTNFNVKVDRIDEKIAYSLHKFGRTINKIYLDDNFGSNISRSAFEDGFVLHGAGQDIHFKVVEDSEDFSLIKISSSSKARDTEIKHCIDLETGRLNWFGGSELFYQYWPIEKVKLENFSYVTKEKDAVGIAERYWLHSDGGFIFVDDNVPLFIDQNINGNTLCLISKDELPYNLRGQGTDLDYLVGITTDVVSAQRKAVKKFLNKPSGTPDRRMVQHPIFSTWARYARDINETTVEAFASEIEQSGFSNSQLEIDDDWEVCYGALTFRETKFTNIKNQTDNLRARGFRVTLWVHPFINKGCEPWYSQAKDNGYLVSNQNGNPDTQWWNSEAGEAAYIDFTRADAVQWYTDRLKTLQEQAGIDSFKFDAGESSWAPPDPKLNAELFDHPLAITKTYIRAVSQFGPIIEVRSGHGTQDLPIFVRFIDKDSEWTFKNGLPTLITALLQMNIVGYGFILPDMIGGNGYNEPPSEELFVRWLQANVFMPSLQYSFVPWDYSQSAIDISKKFTKLHADYTDEIMNAFDELVKNGEPVNPPIWWLDPQDTVALGISDEFLLGTKILSAPVIEEGATSRHIYLPKGAWYDPNLSKTYKGPTWLMDYPAPIDVLPYFIRNV